MIVLQPEWHYAGFWKVSVPGMGIEMLASVWKETLDPNSADHPFYGTADFNYFLLGKQESVIIKPKDGASEDEVIKLFGEMCDGLRQSYGGGEYDFVITKADGLKSFDILMQQPWMRKVEPPKIIMPEEPSLESLIDRANKFLERE